MQPPMQPPMQHGQLDITTAHGATQLILMAVAPTIEIDGHPQKRPWGRHVFDLWPGQHLLRVWFDYLGRSGMAEMPIGIWAGHATMVRYETPFFATSSGKLQMLGSRPLGTW